MTSKKYDIILFGVTGFTGQLAAEYLVQRGTGIRWAVSARNESKARDVLEQVGGGAPDDVDILVVDLVCSTEEEKAKLKAIVEQTKVVLTCSGPFEIYGPHLVELCAQLGVYYADITGETDYFRQTIQRHDKQAQESGAVILCHCGHDCIPCDLLTYELYRFASNHNCELVKVLTYQEFAEEASFSGGTAATAAYQLSKDRTSQVKPAFDPLVTTVRCLVEFQCCTGGSGFRIHVCISHTIDWNSRKLAKSRTLSRSIAVPRELSRYRLCPVARQVHGLWLQSVSGYQ
jgi:short subunit dehydrogenase-like uncharacterized protein